MTLRETARPLALDYLWDDARRVAQLIAWGEVSEDVLDALRSDAGHQSVTNGVVRWHRTDDDTVVVWAGNDHDPGMDWSVVEVQVPR